MSTFDLKVITLDGVMFDGEAESVIARTSVGDVCILARHSNYVGTIEIGKVKIKTADGTKEAACAGGFLSFTDNKARLVATTFEFAEDIDRLRAEKAKEKAEEILSERKSDKEQKMAEIKLKKALLRLNISSNNN